jgi:hypothetical protein
VIGKYVHLQTLIKKGNIKVVLINEDIPQGERLMKLNQIVIQQM